MFCLANCREQCPYECMIILSLPFPLSTSPCSANKGGNRLGRGDRGAGSLSHTGAVISSPGRSVSSVGGKGITLLLSCSETRAMCVQEPYDL